MPELAPYQGHTLTLTALCPHQARLGLDHSCCHTYHRLTSKVSIITCSCADGQTAPTEICPHISHLKPCVHL